MISPMKKMRKNMFKQTLFYLEKPFLVRERGRGGRREGETYECKGRVAVLL